MAASSLLSRLGLELPVIAAPMAGAADHKMAVAIASAGALGSLPAAFYSLDKLRSEIVAFQEASQGSKVNVNFFCHPEPAADWQSTTWEAKVAKLSAEYGRSDAGPGSTRRAFGEEACRLVEELQPGVVSFHFGMPSADLVARIKRSGSVVMASATTVAEATWLADRGADVVIAQGAEAGGHRSNFLGDPNDVATQIGTIALLPQIIDAVDCPVVAAGGLCDGRGIAAAFVLGAHAVQLGSVYLRATESIAPAYHKRALDLAASDSTLLTNVFSGRPARSIRNKATDVLGPLDPQAPPFPNAPTYLAPIRSAANDDQLVDLSSLWSGQAATLAPRTDAFLSAAEITRRIVQDARARLHDAPAMFPGP